MSRVYLDWNATAPLRPEARVAMLAAIDVVGNPSSVHAEGRAAKAIVERARAQVARLVGCDAGEVVFTSGATEAAGLVLRSHIDAVCVSDAEHDAVYEQARGVRQTVFARPGESGRHPDSAFDDRSAEIDLTGGLFAVAAANGETGVVEDAPRIAGRAASVEAGFLTDAVQVIGKMAFHFRAVGADYALCSGHKIGAPKGTGALLLKAGVDLPAPVPGGGQEMGRRSGTENVIGIAGFGAAAEAALRDLEAGIWERVEKLRNILEESLEAAAPELIIFGKEAPRLPNTSCFAIPGWKGETQVMQMDLGGFAISAGSACSSGKVKESRVLRAMGFDGLTASSAIRVSMGPTTTEDEVLGFARTWTDHYRRWRQRAA
ncbi:MAG: cysteine desulfurase family protein [Pseudomonadota bacterium]